jgi:ABC-type transporter Mla subunit MlaD
MANNQIVIDAILVDKVSGAVGKINNAWTEFNSALQIAASAGRVIAGVYDKTVNSTLKYADSVRQLTDISSASSEEASRFIQVLDDYQLTAQDALTATKALTRQGHEPTLDVLAKLSTQYNNLNSEQEKNEFIIKNLGRGGLEWARVLGLGEDAIRALNEEVNKNLVLTEQQSAAAEKYRLQLDQLQDNIEAYKNVIGNALIPVLSDMLTVENRVIQLMEEGMNPYEARRQAVKELAEAEDELIQTEENLNQQLEITYSTLSESESAVKKAIDAYRQFNGQLVSTKQQLAQNAEEIHKWGERMYELQETSNETVGGSMVDNFMEARNTIIKAKQEVAHLTGAIKSFDGMEAYADIYIRVHGSVPRIGVPGTGGATIQSNYINSGDILQFGSGGRNADGAQYVIPPTGGQESFNLGQLGTAQGGEVVTVTNPKKGQVPPGSGGITNSQIRMIGTVVGAEIAKALG